MNVDVSPITGFPNLFQGLDQKMLGGMNPVVLILIIIVIIVYFSLSSNLAGSATSPVSPSSTSSGGLSIIELLLWGIFIFLILVNGLQYFFAIDVEASLKKLFSPEPEVEIRVTDIRPEPQEPEIPEIMIEKQVFNIPENVYTYDEAKALCKAYNARLATYEEVEEAYNKGGEWCNYGWSRNQLALYPTQKETYEKLQQKKGHEHDCGRQGVNGGYIANPNARFGVNCYGYKPEITPLEANTMSKSSPIPLTKEEKYFEKLVNDFKEKIPDIMISPFNNQEWSQV